MPKRNLPPVGSEVDAQAIDQVELQSILMEHNLATFASEMLSGPPEAPYNGHFILGRHHVEWAQHINDHKRLLFRAARDHGKSYMFSKAYPIWKGWKNPRRLGYIFSDTSPMAEERLGEVVDELDSNERLHSLHPLLQIVGGEIRRAPKNSKFKWRARSIHLANGHEIRARGFNTGFRGGHPLWIVLDDVVGDKAASSLAVRNKQIRLFKRAVTPMIVPGGQIICVGTPSHQRDLYGSIDSEKEKNGYKCFTYPALKKVIGRPMQQWPALWPERYSTEALLAIYDEIGDLAFSQEYLCRAVSDLSSLFPSHLFEGEPAVSLHTLGMPRRFWVNEMNCEIYIGVDFAISAESGADYTVIWVVAVDPFGNRWIADIFRGKGMPYKTQKAKLKEYGRIWSPELMFVESNGMQRIFGDELIEETDLPIYKFNMDQTKHSLAKGIPSMRIHLERQKYRIPRGDQRSRELTDVWIEEMGGFAIVDGKIESLTEHDDTGAASFICEQAIRSGSRSFYAPPAEIDLQVRKALDEKMRAATMEVDGMPKFGGEKFAERRILVRPTNPDELDKWLGLSGFKAHVLRDSAFQPIYSQDCMVIVVFGDSVHLSDLLQKQGIADVITAQESEPEPALEPEEPSHETDPRGIPWTSVVRWPAGGGSNTW